MIGLHLFFYYLDIVFNFRFSLVYLLIQQILQLFEQFTFIYMQWFVLI